MVPMRDRVRLNTKVCEAKNATGPLPIIVMRTPYGINELQAINGEYRFLAADGYQFVYQDIRGRYGSEGKFLMNAPLHTLAQGRTTDEATDAYDTVDWLVKNVANNNGRVGVLGVSYRSSQPDTSARSVSIGPTRSSARASMRVRKVSLSLWNSCERTACNVTAGRPNTSCTPFCSLR